MKIVDGNKAEEVQHFTVTKTFRFHFGGFYSTTSQHSTQNNKDTFEGVDGEWELCEACVGMNVKCWFLLVSFNDS